MGFAAHQLAVKLKKTAPPLLFCSGLVKIILFGLSSGSINVTNEMGSVDITRPGFVTEVQANAQQAPPSEPTQATQEQIQTLEQSLSEQAAIEIAKELDVDVDELQLQQGTDTNNDGELG